MSSFEMPHHHQEPTEDALDHGSAKRQLDNADEHIPAGFAEENANIFEPEWMRGLPAERRQELLREEFMTQMMEWLERPEGDPRLEKMLAQSERMRDAAKYVSRAYAGLEFITEQRRTERLAAIGVTDAGESVLTQTPPGHDGGDAA